MRRGARPWERWLWSLLVAASLAFGVRDIAVGLVRVPGQVPVSVAVHDTAVLVHSFPFPAVAVCPKMRVRKRAAMRYLRR